MSALPFFNDYSTDLFWPDAEQDTIISPPKDGETGSLVTFNPLSIVDFNRMYPINFVTGTCLYCIQVHLQGP